MKLTPVAILLALMGISALVHCEDASPIRVGFSFTDTQSLIPHLRAQGYNAEHDDECCQPEEDALGIWIGRKVPIDDVRYIVTQAIQAYPRLVYYSYFGDEGRYPESLDYSIYIGGSKWAAICNTVPVEADVAAKIFDTIVTAEHLHFFLELVETEDAPRSRCVSQ